MDPRGSRQPRPSTHVCKPDFASRTGTQVVSRRVNMRDGGTVPSCRGWFIAAILLFTYLAKQDGPHGSKAFVASQKGGPVLDAGRTQALTGMLPAPIAVEPSQETSAARQSYLPAAVRSMALAAMLSCRRRMSKVESLLPRRRGGERNRVRVLAAGTVGFVQWLVSRVESVGSTPGGVMARLSMLNFAKIYMALMVLRITIMWFPNLNPYRQPFYAMMQLTDPYLNLFRGWMPPIFGMDLSAILAFAILQALIDVLTISPY
mmetsp:Transcript_11813/g.26806  ORF Transcript_11813/g.26806 Transcript_11813/m.26806 type:complete len:261 (-) Transcript_11813:69-851(-)